MKFLFDIPDKKEMLSAWHARSTKKRIQTKTDVIMQRKKKYRGIKRYGSPIVQCNSTQQTTTCTECHEPNQQKKTLAIKMMDCIDAVATVATFFLFFDDLFHVQQRHASFRLQSNLCDGEIQPGVDDERGEEDEEGSGAKQRLLEHDDPGECVAELHKIK